MDKIPNKKFVELRKKLSLSQVDLAKQLSVSQGTITDIERGRIGVSKRVVKKLLEVFGQKSVELRVHINEINNEKIQEKKLGYGQGNALNPSEKGFRGEQKSIVDIYNMVERLYSKDLNSIDRQKLIENEVLKLEDKTLSYYIRSSKEIQKERPELVEAHELVMMSLEDTYTLFNIVHTYFQNILNTPQFTDYENFKIKRVENFEKQLQYKDILKPLSKALNKFLKDFEEFDTKGLIKK